MRYLPLLLLLSSCTVNVYEIRRAQQVCRRHGGLEYIELPLLAHCKNGVYTLNDEEINKKEYHETMSYPGIFDN